MKDINDFLKKELTRNKKSKLRGDDQEDNGKKPQWRADRRKAKRLKNQELGI